MYTHFEMISNFSEMYLFYLCTWHSVLARHYNKELKFNNDKKCKGKQTYKNCHPYKLVEKRKNVFFCFQRGISMSSTKVITAGPHSWTAVTPRSNLIFCHSLTISEWVFSIKYFKKIVKTDSKYVHATYTIDQVK